MVVYLRSLKPTGQTGVSLEAGVDDGGGASDVTVVGIGADASLACGTSTCGGGQVCCVMAGYRNDSGLLNGSCTDPTGCSAFALACNGAQDCPAGEVCCGQLSGTTATASCQASCGPNDDQVCQMPKECPMGDGCRDYPFGGGIKTCQPLKGDGGHDGGRHDGAADDASGE
jgi:hypothetical protein